MQHPDAAAPWKRFSGPKRVQAEFKRLSRAGLGMLSGLCLVDDDLCTWRFKLKDFDEDVDGGSQLNADLRRLAAA